jgi:hypothetical protein
MPLRAWYRKQSEIRKSLRKTYIHRLVGDRLFSHVLWKIDKRSMAGGMALGLFIAFTPTIPFQMLLATCGAVYWRVNLPVAVAACWITNPVTAVPIYMAAMQMGKLIVTHLPVIGDILNAYTPNNGASRAIRSALNLWVGSLLFSSAAAIGAQIVIRSLWNLIRKLVHKVSTSKDKPDVYGVDGYEQ